MENKVSVVIGDEIITLKSNENPEYLQRLALYVDAKMSELLKKSSMSLIDEKVKTLLIALNIADDYLKTLDICKQIDEVHTKYVMESGNMKEENAKLKKELKQKKAELDEFIKNFEDTNGEDGEPNNILTMPVQKKNRKTVAR